MTRTLAALIAVLGLSSFARGQDMPLSQILIEGEGWKKVEGARRPEILRGILAGTAEAVGYVPAGYVVSRGTLYAGVQNGRSLIAFTLDSDRTPGHSAAFAPLRLKRGTKGIDVTCLTTDRDGRIYAATEIGVQVFDPTGRLCGVLTPAAPGTSQLMDFELDHLTLWIGNTKYTRKLNTRAAR